MVSNVGEGANGQVFVGAWVHQHMALRADVPCGWEIFQSILAA